MGIICVGVKLVNVIFNSCVLKISLLLGGSYGVGNYVMCGKVFDLWLIFVWLIVCYVVMGVK